MRQYISYNTTIKMKPIDLKSSTYIYFGVKSNGIDPTLNVDDHVRISMYKTIFAKCYNRNWLDEQEV